MGGSLSIPLLRKMLRNKKLR